MKTCLRTLFIPILLLALSACTSESYNLTNPSEQPTKSVAAGRAEVKVSPPNYNVDILFIIDQSTSMAAIIKEVHQNISSFSKVFLDKEKNNVKFRIGVAKAWDTHHFESTLVDQWNLYGGIYRSHLIPFNPHADSGVELPNLDFSDLSIGLSPLVINGKKNHNPIPVITPDLKNIEQILKDTLAIDVEVYKYEIDPVTKALRTPYEITQSGPFLSLKKSEINNIHLKSGSIENLNKALPGHNIYKFNQANPNEDVITLANDIPLYGPSPSNEEFFTVINEFLDNKALRESYGDFPSAEANHFAVFIISDAEDDSNQVNGILPEEIFNKMASFMGSRKKVTVHGALFTAEDSASNCKVRKLDNEGRFVVAPSRPKEATKYVTQNKKRDPGKINASQAEELARAYSNRLDALPEKEVKRRGEAHGFNPEFDKASMILKLTRKYKEGLLVGAPVKIEELIRISGGQLKSICDSNFGPKLADVGFQIKKQTITQNNARIRIEGDYDIDSVRIFYGDPDNPKNEIPKSITKGWSLAADFNNSQIIEINSKAFKYDENKTFRVVFDQIVK